MLFPAARFMIGPETIQERFGKEKIETKHHRDPGKSDPLQAQHRNAPGKRHHTLTETLPLDNQPLRKCMTPDKKWRETSGLFFDCKVMFSLFSPRHPCQSDIKRRVP